MVLSNKKLKQKLRAAVAESLTATGDSSTESPLETQSLKGLLSNASQKPRLSKREKRKELLSLEGKSEPTRANEGTQNDIEENDLKKKKKRKRPDDKVHEGEESERLGGADGNGEVKKEGELKKNAKKKKKKKKKKKNQKKSANESEDRGSGEAGSGLTESTQEAVKDNQKKQKGKMEGTDKGIDNAETKKVENPVKSNASQENGAFAMRVYVGGIPYFSTEDDIRSFFDSCGTITDVDCMTFPESGKFRGIAILTFKTEAAAKRALAFDGADMGGLFLKIQPYNVSRAQKKASDFAPEMIEGYNRIYVGNLSWDITEDDLKKLLSGCSISSIRFGTDKTTGEFRGYAHVDFRDSASLAKALKLDERVICGRPVRIRCAVPKKESETHPGSENRREQEAGSGSTGTKKKRRTCYECGVPGHVSSSCPKKNGG